MNILLDSKRKLQMYHLIYWLLFVAFFTIIWGSYDDDYERNFMVQLLSLPSRLTLVYGTLLFLFPKFFDKEQVMKFIIGYFLLLVLCTVFIQRPVILYIVEGKYLPNHASDKFFNVVDLTNTIMDVNVAAIIPVGSKLVGAWVKSKKRVNELQVINQKLTNYKNQFILFKKGSHKHKIFLHNIVYLESVKNNVKVVTTEKEYLFYGSITALEETLKSREFVRVHRSFIVNLSFMESFSNTDITVKEFKIPIGRKYKANVSNVLKV